MTNHSNVRSEYLRWDFPYLSVSGRAELERKLFRAYGNSAHGHIDTESEKQSVSQAEKRQSGKRVNV